ncbi:hypothetical protein [Cupriavidus pinatubonensis]|uniref:Transmembrane protein n=1 Tax=Cupriavidus pinatubonensis TaxID=248026 RepID=A0ABM8X1N9_9BURK|nr:hypothetical protein [Cupriavidus pinatubonensis]CAG9173793.1 hypothetical protein LMG23994_02711 [Cupriavidus pinatubonensis]
MEFASSAWHVLSAFMTFALGTVIALMIGVRLGLGRGRSIFLYLWHSIFCVIYAFVVVEFGGDSLVYFEESLTLDQDFSFGTIAVNYLTGIFSNQLDFSFLGTFLVFNIFGVIGMLAFDAALQQASRGKDVWVRRMASLIVLLPSLSFWTSAIGKDGIAFMATGLALWANLALSRRFAIMGLSVALMFFVRPHIAALMIAAIGATVMVSSRITWPQRLTVAVILTLAAALVVPYALNYGRLDDANSVADVAEYVETRQAYNQEGGGAIQLENISLPMQLFAYVFRPLPFEANSLLALAASMDNVLILLTFIVGGRGILKGGLSETLGNRAFLWIYSSVSWLIAASMTANLGISVRQKWMFLPMVIFVLVCSANGARRSNRRSGEPLVLVTGKKVTEKLGNGASR